MVLLPAVAIRMTRIAAIPGLNPASGATVSQTTRWIYQICIDAHRSGIDSVRVQELSTLNLCPAQRVTRNQEIIVRDQNGKFWRYSQILIFGLRPPELTHVAPNLKSYFCVFRIGDGVVIDTEMEHRLSISICECEWMIDVLGRCAKLQWCALNEARKMTEANLSDGRYLANNSRRCRFLLIWMKWFLKWYMCHVLTGLTATMLTHRGTVHSTSSSTTMARHYPRFQYSPRWTLSILTSSMCTSSYLLVSMSPSLMSCRMGCSEHASAKRI